MAYTKEDFNKDLEKIKETLKNIDYSSLTKEQIENIKEGYKTLSEKLSEKVANNEIPIEEFKENISKMKEQLKNIKIDDDFLDNISSKLNDGINKAIDITKSLFSKLKSKTEEEIIKHQPNVEDIEIIDEVVEELVEDDV